MDKKVWIQGKPYRHSQLTEEQIELYGMLNQEKELTAYWYERMSGQKQWTKGEREVVALKSEGLAELIDGLIASSEVEELSDRLDREP